MADAGRRQRCLTGDRAELLLTSFVLVSLGWIAWRFAQTGYLPQPFYYLKSDTLMDWFNTAYWAHRPGAYERWRAIYPPLSLDFLKLFSLQGCYDVDPGFARDCDWVGKASLLAFFLVNAVLAFRCYRRNDPNSAAFRTLAVAFGFPALFALERGNLVVPCFTVFILAESGLLRGRWRRVLAFAIAVNLKPYLVVTSLPLIVTRRWTAFAASALACLCVYALSFAVEGSGSPIQLVHNFTAFAHSASANYWNDFYNPTSYVPLLNYLFFNATASSVVPSWLLHSLPVALIGTMALGLAGVLFCYGAVYLGRVKAAPTRLAAMALAVILTTTGASGYAEIFLLFLAFLERWQNGGCALVLTGAYLLCIPADFIMARAPMAAMPSWLSHHQVTPIAGIAIGQFLRPALLLLVEFGLVAATIADLRAARRAPRAAAKPERLLVGQERRPTTASLRPLAAKRGEEKPLHSRHMISETP